MDYLSWALQAIISPFKPTDGGPIYAETLIGQPPFVEPWNSLSSLVIALPGLLFLFTVDRRKRGSTFIFLAALLLLTGGIGSALFHGLRNSHNLLLMDWVPIAILSVLVAIVFWKRVLRNWALTAVVILALFYIRYLIYEYMTGAVALNLSYLISGITIFLPCLIFIANSKFFKAKYIFISITLWVLALLCRTFDKEPAVMAIFPMGIHFLWHTFSGLGAYYIGRYILATAKVD